MFPLFLQNVALWPRWRACVAVVVVVWWPQQSLLPGFHTTFMSHSELTLDMTHLFLYLHSLSITTTTTTTLISTTTSLITSVGSFQNLVPILGSISIPIPPFQTMEACLHLLKWWPLLKPWPLPPSWDIMGPRMPLFCSSSNNSTLPAQLMGTLITALLMLSCSLSAQLTARLTAAPQQVISSCSSSLLAQLTGCHLKVVRLCSSHFIRGHPSCSSSSSSSRPPAHHTTGHLKVVPLLLLPSCSQRLAQFTGHRQLLPLSVPARPSPLPLPLFPPPPLPTSSLPHPLPC